MSLNVPATVLINNNNDKIKQTYGKIQLSLENSLLSNDKLYPTPSVEDGLNYDHELDLRILGCELIQMSGILLKLPQVAMATGQVLFQRYYYSKSLVRYPMEVTAMACVTLASKIEEAPRRIRDVINVFHHIKQSRNSVEFTPLILDENYVNVKNQVIKAERRLLKELGFCVHVKHPHKIIVTLLQVLDNEKNQLLMQTSWNYMNDSLRTHVFVRYSPEAIACACIYLSARVLKVPLPNNPPWYEIFNVSETDIEDICQSVLKLYARKKPNQEALEKIIEELRKDHEIKKLRAKGIIPENGTPNFVELSPGSKTNSPINNNLRHTESSPLRHPKTAQNTKNDNENSPVKRKRSPIALNRHSKSPSKSPHIRNNYDNSNKYDNYDHSDHEAHSKNYQYRDVYSRSRSRDRDKDRRHRHHRHHSKHKRNDYSRSRSNSPYHNYYNNKHYSSNAVKKSRKRSKSPYDRHYHSKSRRSRSRDIYVNRSPRR